MNSEWLRLRDIAAADAAPIEDVARPLGLRVADRLRERILTGALKPGVSLTEQQVAADLQVSRAPVREAIRLLAAEGLIELAPYRGAAVRGPTAKDIEEIYSLREQFELFAARRILARDDAPSLKDLREASAAMGRAARADDIDALNHADQDFHRALIREARHDLLLEMWSAVAMRVRQVIALTNRANRNLMLIAANHPPIVTALRRRDLARVEALLQAHVRSARELATPIAAEQAPGR